MALDKDIVGSIEFLEVVGLQGSTYLLKGPNGENVKLNQSEMNDDDELEVGEEYSFFIYPNRSGELFATQNMPDITKDKYDFAKVLKTDRDGARIDVGLPREVLVPWEDLPKVKSLWPQPGDYLLVTLRIDRENHMYGRLASESVVENMFTPVHDDNLKNEVIEAKPYRVLRIGSFLLSESGYKIFVHESERKAEPR
ncbi:RNA-binding virulence regulatory protein CvfB, partial [Staphylococcus aureus]|nr:RNA-binding virulence regulatory protein CvfB [Staphylococcus aureus]